MCVANIQCVGLWGFRRQNDNHAIVSNRLCHERGAAWWHRRRSGTRRRRVHRNGGTEFSLLVSPIANAKLIKFFAFFKTVKAETFVEFVFLVMRNCVRVGEA